MAEKWTPHAGQMKAVKFLLSHAAAAVFADPGVGKTASVYAAIKVLKRKEMIGKVLIIAPLRVCHLVWPAERDKWSDFSGLKVVVLHGPKKAELLHSEADVYVTNPESLDWLLGAAHRKSASGRVEVTMDVRAFRNLGFDTLVVDELTMFKHTQSVRFRTLKAVLGTFSRRWGLTGTPVPNGFIDLFGQCYVLDGGRSLGQYVTHYRANYFLPSYDGFGWVLKKGAEELIYERLRPLALRLAAEDYVDMPDLVEDVKTFDLPPAARKVYDAMEDVMLTRLDGDLVTAANAGAALTKLHQISNGACYTDDLAEPTAEPRPVLPKDRRPWKGVHDEKLDLLEVLVDGLQGTPLLCAYEFRHDLERLRKRFGDVPVLGSGTTTAESKRIESEWNAGAIPLLLGHPRSIGHGLNLQGSGNHVAWFSLPWDLEMYDQFNRRVRRQGSKHQTVFAHILLARDTVDEAIHHALKGKAKGQAALLHALRDMRDRRRGAVGKKG